MVSLQGHFPLVKVLPSSAPVAESFKMQMASSIDTDDGEMIVKRVSVPIGLEELMEGLTKEVIAKKPKDIYAFASEYFAHLLSLREKGLRATVARRAQSVTKQYPTTDNVDKKLKIKSKSVDPVKQLSRQTNTRVDSSSKKTLTTKKIVLTSKEDKNEKSDKTKSFLDKRRARKDSKENILSRNKKLTRDESATKKTPRGTEKTVNKNEAIDPKVNNESKLQEKQMGSVASKDTPALISANTKQIKKDVETVIADLEENKSEIESVGSEKIIPTLALATTAQNYATDSATDTSNVSSTSAPTKPNKSIEIKKEINTDGMAKNVNENKIATINDIQNEHSIHESMQTEQKTDTVAFDDTPASIVENKKQIVKDTKKVGSYSEETNQQYEPKTASLEVVKIISTLASEHTEQNLASKNDYTPDVLNVPSFSAPPEKNNSIENETKTNTEESLDEVDANNLNKINIQFDGNEKSASQNKNYINEGNQEEKQIESVALKDTPASILTDTKRTGRDAEKIVNVNSKENSQKSDPKTQFVETEKVTASFASEQNLAKKTGSAAKMSDVSSSSVAIERNDSIENKTTSTKESLNEVDANNLNVNKNHFDGDEKPSENKKIPQERKQEEKQIESVAFKDTPALIPADTKQIEKDVEKVVNDNSEQNGQKSNPKIDSVEVELESKSEQYFETETRDSVAKKSQVSSSSAPIKENNLIENETTNNKVDANNLNQNTISNDLLPRENDKIGLVSEQQNTRTTETAATTNEEENKTSLKDTLNTAEVISQSSNEARKTIQSNAINDETYNVNNAIINTGIQNDSDEIVKNNLPKTSSTEKHVEAIVKEESQHLDKPSECEKDEKLDIEPKAEEFKKDEKITHEDKPKIEENNSLEELNKDNNNAAIQNKSPQINLQEKEDNEPLVKKTNVDEMCDTNNNDNNKFTNTADRKISKEHKEITNNVVTEVNNKESINKTNETVAATNAAVSKDKIDVEEQNKKKKADDNKENVDVNKVMKMNEKAEDNKDTSLIKDIVQSASVEAKKSKPSVKSKKSLTKTLSEELLKINENKKDKNQTIRRIKSVDVNKSSELVKTKSKSKLSTESQTSDTKAQINEKPRKVNKRSISADLHKNTVKNLETTVHHPSFDSSNYQKKHKGEKLKMNGHVKQIKEDVKSAESVKKEPHRIMKSINEVIAAVKIQSIWRGFKIRKQLENIKKQQQIKNNLTADNQDNENENKEQIQPAQVESIPINKESRDSMADAVVRIQAIWRGFKVRKQVNTAEPEKHSKINKKSTPNDTVDVTENKSRDESKTRQESMAGAALKIQTLWRGFRVRKQKSKLTRSESTKETMIINKELKETAKAPIVDSINDNQNSMADAVLKIQALWRGFKVRKHLRNGELFGASIDSAPKAREELLKIAAVSKIQAHWRGYKVRKNIKEVNSRLEQLEKHLPKDGIPHERKFSDEDVFRAASKIQAGIRGYMVRKNKNEVGGLKSITEEPICEDKLSDKQILEEINKLDDIPTNSPITEHKDEKINTLEGGDVEKVIMNQTGNKSPKNNQAIDIQEDNKKAESELVTATKESNSSTNKLSTLDTSAIISDSISNRDVNRETVDPLSHKSQKEIGYENATSDIIRESSNNQIVNNAEANEDNKQDVTSQLTDDTKEKTDAAKDQNNEHISLEEKHERVMSQDSTSSIDSVSTVIFNDKHGSKYDENFIGSAESVGQNVANTADGTINENEGVTNLKAINNERIINEKNNETEQNKSKLEEENKKCKPNEFKPNQSTHGAVKKENITTENLNDKRKFETQHDSDCETTKEASTKEVNRKLKQINENAEKFQKSEISGKDKLQSTSSHQNNVSNTGSLSNSGQQRSEITERDQEKNRSDKIDEKVKVVDSPENNQQNVSIKETKDNWVKSNKEDKHAADCETKKEISIKEVEVNSKHEQMNESAEKLKKNEISGGDKLQNTSTHQNNVFNTGNLGNSEKQQRNEFTEKDLEKNRSDKIDEKVKVVDSPENNQQNVSIKDNSVESNKEDTHDADCETKKEISIKEVEVNRKLEQMYESADKLKKSEISGDDKLQNTSPHQNNVFNTGNLGNSEKQQRNDITERDLEKNRSVKIEENVKVENKQQNVSLKDIESDKEDKHGTDVKRESENFMVESIPRRDVQNAKENKDIVKETNQADNQTSKTNYHKESEQTTNSLNLTNTVDNTETPLSNVNILTNNEFKSNEVDDDKDEINKRSTTAKDLTTRNKKDKIVQSNLNETSNEKQYSKNPSKANENETFREMTTLVVKTDSSINDENQANTNEVNTEKENNKLNKMLLESEIAHKQTQENAVQNIEKSNNNNNKLTPPRPNNEEKALEQHVECTEITRSKVDSKTTRKLSDIKEEGTIQEVVEALKPNENKLADLTYTNKVSESKTEHLRINSENGEPESIRTSKDVEAETNEMKSRMEEQPSGSPVTLVHTGEFHDTITVPINLTPPRTPPSEEVQEAPSPGLVHTGELHDHVVPLTVHLDEGAPAGAEVLTSSLSESIDDGLERAQASNKDASTCGAQSDNTTPPSNSMETEKRNNASVQKKSMEAEAATKIQAGFRGYQVRKQLKNQIISPGESTNNRRTPRRKSSGKITDSGKITQAKTKQPSTEIEEQSAVKIQAGIRGFLVRRRQKKQKTGKESS